MPTPEEAAFIAALAELARSTREYTETLKQLREVVEGK